MILSVCWACGSCLALQLRHRRSGQCPVPLETPRSSCASESHALVLATRNTKEFVYVLDLHELQSSGPLTHRHLSCASLLLFLALVISTQLHIHHLIRELQLVYLNSLLDLLDFRHLSLRSAACSAPAP